MKKIFSLIAVLMFSLLVMAGCKKGDEYYNDNGKKDQKVLTMVTSPDYAPYEFVKDVNAKGWKKYGGADIEVGKFIAKELGMKLLIKEAAFDTCPALVNAGKADISISGFSYTKERAEAYELSETYFAEGDGKQQVLVLKANADKYNKLADLDKAEVKVAAQSGSLQESLVKENLTNATKETFTNVDLAMEFLKSGKYDAIALAEHTIEVKMNGNDDFSVVEEDFDIAKLGMVVLAKKGNTELIEKINAAVAKIKEQNLYAGWMETAKKEAKDAKVE